MATPIGRVLDVGTKFFYEYDFGSTTELRLTVVGFWNLDKPKGAVQLLAGTNRLRSSASNVKLSPPPRSARHAKKPGFANRAPLNMIVVRRCFCPLSTLPALGCVPIPGNRSGQKDRVVRRPP